MRLGGLGRVALHSKAPVDRSCLPLLSAESAAGADAAIAPARWARARIVAEARDAGTLRRYICVDVAGLEPLAYASEWISVADSRVAPLGVFTMSSSSTLDCDWEAEEPPKSSPPELQPSPPPVARTATMARLAATLAAALNDSYF